MPKFLRDYSANDLKAETNNAVSPMPGIFDKILVKVGDVVSREQPVAVIIAMKMEYVLKAPKNGTVKSVCEKLGKSKAKSFKNYRPITLIICVLCDYPLR